MSEYIRDVFVFSYQDPKSPRDSFAIRVVPQRERRHPPYEPKYAEFGGDGRFHTPYSALPDMTAILSVFSRPGFQRLLSRAVGTWTKKVGNPRAAGTIMQMINERAGHESQRPVRPARHAQSTTATATAPAAENAPAPV
jgi:hypothetical protein